ncbi:nucleoside deaminase [Aquimarina rhabdastrellae]
MHTYSHEYFMDQALQLANEAVDDGNHPFAALLVHNQEIILEAKNSIHTSKDITRHAELNLVSKASQLYTSTQLAEMILYTTTEPCAMCSGAIYWSGIKTIIYAASATHLDQIAGKFLACHSTQVFKNALNPPIVIGGILEHKAILQHQKYWLNL